MKSNQINKTLIHFDTINNLNIGSSPYNNCHLKINESYKNIHSISLKSVELLLPTNIMPDNCNYFQYYKPVTINGVTKSVLITVTFDFSQLKNFSIATLINNINNVVNIPNDDGSYINFMIASKGYISIRFYKFSDICNICESPLLRLLGMTNEDLVQTCQINSDGIITSAFETIGTIGGFLNVSNSYHFNSRI